MQITKIERQKKNAARATVYIDGAFGFGVSDEVLIRYTLHTGMELTERFVEELAEADSEDTGKQKAMRYLGIRPRTRREIATYLARKGYSEMVTSRVIERLVALRLLDDAEFARMFCRDRLKLKPTGSQLLKKLLLQKGVPRPTAEEVMAEFFEPETEQTLAAAAAARFLRKKLEPRSADDEAAVKRRLLDHLLRRGFSYEVARHAIDQLYARQR
jgi:regulatory protein